MKIGKAVFVFLILCLIQSCSIISLERLSVTSNLSEDISFFNEPEIHIRFSIAPDKQSFEDSVSMYVDGKVSDSTIRWVDSKNCFIIPADSWKKGSLYKLTVDSSLKMEDGRFYSVSLYRMFIYGEDYSFEMINCSIPDGGMVQSDSTLSFTFSKAIDELSFINSFSLTPSISNTITFSSDKKVVTITPNDHWVTNSVYKWKLTKLQSDDDYPLKKSYEGLFKAPEDTVLPFVEGIYPVVMDHGNALWHTELNAETELRVSDSLGIIFSEPVRKESLEKAISFSPSISGYVIQADTEGKKYIWCIEDNWKNETEYQLKISTSLEDMNYMPLLDDFSYYFTPTSNYFVIEIVQIGSLVVSDDFDAGYDVVIPSDSILEIKIVLNRGISDEYKEIFFNAFSLQSFFPSTAISPSLVAASWSGSSENILTLRYSGYTVSTANVTNYYQLKTNGLSSEKLDEYGNMLKEELCVYFSIS